MKKLVNKKSIILFVTILLLCTRMLYLYSIRCSHFIDELYSVGFANSENMPFFIYPETDEYGNQYLRHFQEWCDGKELLDYVTVAENERFDFLNVINNKLQDTAPPNYELMVHFVSSLFPETFSWAYPFAVNFLFYIFSLILVFLISKDLVRDKNFSFMNAYICMIFFAFTIAGTGAFTFLRMYGVLSFYGLLMLYALQKLIYCKEVKKEIAYTLVLFVAVFLGLLTHTLFVVFAFWLTLFTCLYLLFEKRILESIKRGLAVLASLLTFVAIYPFKYERVGSWMEVENNNGYSYWTKLIYSNMHMFGESLGFYIPFTYVHILIWFGIAFLIFSVLFAVCFICRNEAWYKSLRSRFLNHLDAFKKYVSCVFKNICPENFIMFLTALAYMLTINAITPVNTQYYVTRYFMPGMFPLILCFVSFINSCWFSAKEKRRNKVCSIALGLLVVLLLNQNLIYHNPFYFNKPYDNDENLHELTAGENVMIFGFRKNSLYSLIVPLRDVSSFYYGLYTDDIESLTEFPDDSFYIMIDRNCFAGEDSRSPLIDGLGLEGTTDEFASTITSTIPYECSAQRVMDFYSFAGDYAVYEITRL